MNCCWLDHAFDVLLVGAEPVIAVSGTIMCHGDRHGFL
jgi:hypothetical protein